MKQIIVNPSDTIQILPGMAEGHEAQSLSSQIADGLSLCVDSCSQRLLDVSWLNGLNIAITLLVVLFAVSIWKPNIKIGLLRHLKIQAFFIWVCGVILYMVGFNEHGSAASNVALLLRSCLSSMEMFVSHSDLIEVNEELHGNATYMALFALTHFCAVAISAIFILRLFGFRLLSWMKAVWFWMWSRMRRECNYYVMFGVNANTLALAKSIDDNKTKRHRIIFINMPDKGHGHASTRFSFSHFFHSDSDGIDKYLEEIERMGALLFSSSRSFGNAIVNEKDKDKGKEKNLDVFHVFKALDFSEIVYIPLQKLLREASTRGCDKSKVNFFFLSDEENENLAAVAVLQKLQKTLIDYKNTSFNCYCHARKNRINSSMLNSGNLAFRVHIVDTSNLAALELKKNKSYHPVNFVEKDTDLGIVKSAFTGMVIGFGETGRDVFRFLYEFSSFPKDDKGAPSEKKIHVIDKNIEELKADFLNDAPALRHSRDIEWWGVSSIHSEAFWKKLGDVIQSLNYAVISVKDDEEAAEIATSIFEYAYRYRNNLDSFKIFVRLRKSMRADFLRSHREFSNVIIPFGAVKDAFSFSTINNEVLEKKAKRFKYRYDILNDNNFDTSKYSSEEEGAADVWLQRRLSYQGETDGSKRKEGEIKVWYQEEQDCSNAWHVYTKIALANDSITPEALFADCNKRLLSNLCNCEHLRWNAKMHLLGFEPARKEDTQNQEERTDGKLRGTWKNFKLRRHECIVDCRTLHANPVLASTIPYDESTVKLSFEMREEE